MYNIDRFVEMHKEYYAIALHEIKNGYKKATGCGIYFHS